MYLGGVNKIGQKNTILIPITLLLLFVCSASITGYLMFAKPITTYLDGNKKEAISLLTHTILYLFLITFTSLLFLIFFTR